MRWFRNRKLSIQLGVSLGLIVVIAFGALIGNQLLQMYKTSLELGEATAKETSLAGLRDFQQDLTDTETHLETLQATLLDGWEHGSVTREDMIRILQAELQNNPHILALYTLWEPNAFDGEDVLHKNKQPYDDATGRFIPYVVHKGESIGIDPLVDYEQEGAGDYYLIPKKTKQTAWIDPYYYPVNGEDILITSLVLPILDEKGNFMGIVGADFSLDVLQKQLETITPLGGYTALVSESGRYVANGKYPDKRTKPFADNADSSLVWQQLNGGIEFTYAPDKGKEQLYLFTPVRLSSTDTNWHMISVIPKKNILESFYSSLIEVGIIAFVSLLLLAAVIMLTVRFIVRQVSLVNAMSAKMSEGNLTEKLPVTSKDEFGTMAVYLNQMTDNLRSMISTVSERSLSIGATSQQLNAAAEQTSSSAEAVAASIQEIATGAEAQVHDLEETHRAMNEIAAGVGRIAESSLDMSDASKAAAEHTRSGNDNIQKAVQQMNGAAAIVRETSGIIQSLSKRSQDIGTIVGMITSVSTQTSILALNASIEAARAGEHGRGFAVVAAEIRKLAEQSHSATEQVAELIETIQEETRAAVSSMAHGSAEVEQGVAAMEESGNLFAMIMDQVNGVNRQIEGVTAAAEQISASTEQVTATVEQLMEIGRDASGNAANVATASEQQLATMEEITSSSESLAEMVQELLDLMARFKV
jgi:methyl-accepting chemotaxis protein